MIKTIAICDNCNKDLPPNKFIFKLTSEMSPTSNSGVVKAVRIYKPFDSEKTFCSVDCLKNWINNNLEIK